MTEMESASINCNGIGGGNERLLKRLGNMESTIDELLTLKQATPVLKEKLCQVDEIILDIQDGDVAIQWRNKVAVWWKKFAIQGTTEESMASGGAFRRGLRSMAGGTGGQLPIGSERRVGSGQFDRQQYRGSDGSRTVFNSDSNSYQFPKEYREEREKILAELAQDFRSFPDLEGGFGTDISALRRLFGVIRKARTVTHSFDSALKEDIFVLGYRKLSPEHREAFLDQFGTKKLLFNLANYLREQMDTYYQDLNKSDNGGAGGVQSVQNGYRHGANRSGSFGDAGSEQMGSYFDGRGQGYQQDGRRFSGGADASGNSFGQQQQQPYVRPEIGPNQCRYCRMEGHRIADCAERNAKLCFNCNQPGHTARYCKSGNSGTANNRVVVTMDNASN